MDFGYILTRSGQLMWRHKSLWWLGLFGNLIAFMALLGSQYFRTRFLTVINEFVLAETPPSDVELAQMALDFIVAEGPILLLMLFGILLVGWLLNAMAEGGIIQAIWHDDRDEPVTLGQALEDGVGTLGKFIAIDTLVFFPLFVMALISMIVMVASFGGFVWQAAQTETFDPQQAAPFLGLILCCVFPLSVLSLPTTLVGLMMRVMAFRDVTLFNLGAWATIKHTWQVIKPRWFEVLLLFVMVWALQGLLRFIIRSAISILSAGLMFSNISQLEQLEQNPLDLFSPSVMVLEVVATIPDIFLWTFTAILFTVGYQQLLPTQEGDSNDSWG